MPRSTTARTADRLAFPEHPRIRFVGGKGGVGKTTCAALLGVSAAKEGRRTLLVSTDPAPSLGDALAGRVGPAPGPVPAVTGLHAVEIDGRSALARWVRARRPALERIALRGSWLDEQDVSRLLDLALPGADEIGALLEIARLAAAPYDEIIVDAAPTGHLLRLLETPAVLDGFARVFAHMQARHRLVAERLGGRAAPDAADALLDEIAREAQRMAAMLRDPAQAAVCWTTLPEPMAIAESVDAVRWLRTERIVVDAVIVNRVTPPPPGPCRWCDAGRRFERAAMQDLAARPDVRRLAVLRVPAASREPRGARALAALAAAVEPGLPRRSRARRPLRASVIAGVAGMRTVAPEQPVMPPGAQLVLFGGKGGVGKTTCAAAAALAAARQAPERRILLLSVDPAHSIADALGRPVLDAARPIRGEPPNLLVRELDAARAFARVRDRAAAAIEMAAGPPADSRAGVVIAPQDREVMRELLDLAPPGLDELVAMIEIVSVLGRGTAPPEEGGAPPRFDLVIVDTAPTGHALRLLELPALVHAWVKALMSILLKYRPVARLGDLAELLLRLSQAVGDLRTLLGDAGRTRFVAVTRSGALPAAETLRMLTRLRRVGIRVPIVVVNAVGAGGCRRCMAQRSTAGREIADLCRRVQRSGRRDVLVAPAEMPPPHGPARLRAWRARWRQLPRARR